MSEPIGLACVGVSHHTAPLTVREQLTLDETKKGELYERLLAESSLLEVAVLSTCNRIEIYAVPSTGDCPSKVVDHLCDVAGLPRQECDRYSSHSQDLEVAQHLMEVCAGLDSQMIGETEILGQVKQAYQEATERKATGPLLHRLFQKSFQAAKWVRTNTGIGFGQVSLGNVSADLARRIFGQLSASRTLVVGSGQVGADVAKALVSRGVQQVTVTSRTASKAEALAKDIGANAISFDAWTERLSEFDIIVLCTAAPGIVLSSQVVAKAVSKRPSRPLFLIDLAMPRDVEASVSRMPNVFLYTFDDLAAIANNNLDGRKAEIEACRQELRVRSERLWQDLGRIQAQERPAG